MALSVLCVMALHQVRAVRAVKRARVEWVREHMEAASKLPFKF